MDELLALWHAVQSHVPGWRTVREARLALIDTALFIIGVQPEKEVVQPAGSRCSQVRHLRSLALGFYYVCKAALIARREASTKFLLGLSLGHIELSCYEVDRWADIKVVVQVIEIGDE